MKHISIGSILALLLGGAAVLFWPQPTSAATFCGEPTAATLYAGQTTDVGTVTIANDTENLYITFDTTWALAETHLHVADSLDDIPQAQGNPPPGQFDYQTDHNPPVQTTTYTVPLGDFAPGNDLVIAAHAEVVKLDAEGNVIAEESAWSAGADFPGANWATYSTYTVQTCVEEPTGCTRPSSYWRTHSKYGPATYDETWASFGEDTPFFLSPRTWYGAIWFSSGGDAYYILAEQYIAARLNVEAGASTPDNVADIIERATTFYENREPGIFVGDPLFQRVLNASTTLDDYNDGRIGPGACLVPSSGSSSTGGNPIITPPTNPTE